MNPKLLMNSLRLGLIVAIALAAVPRQRAFALGTRRYARPGGGVSGACTSWATACQLRYLLPSQAQTGDEVWVAAGRYTAYDTSRSNSLIIPNGVGVYGGFAGNETQLSQRNWQANVTILSGDIDDDGGPANSTYHVVDISHTTNITVLDGFTIMDGNSDVLPGYGAGIYSVNGNARLRNLIVLNNIASARGGGLYSDGGSPSLSNVTFIFNHTGTGDGGGMFVTNGSPALNSVRFIENDAYEGGGLYASSGSTPALTDVTFMGNQASFGGGMENNAGTASLLRTRFIGNATQGSDPYGHGGGVLTINGGHSNLTQVSFSGNRADRGAGIYSGAGTTVDLSRVTFTGNTATWAAMFNSGSHVTINRSTFTGNQAQVGGAIFNGSSSVVTLTNSSFKANQALATDGGGDGGAINNADSSLTLKGVTFSGNQTVTYGGALYTWGTSSVNLVNTTFNTNQAGTSGGAIFVLEGALSLKHVTISGNTAPTGAALSNAGGTATVDRSILWADGTSEIAGGGTTLTNSILKNACPLGVTCGANVLHKDPQLGLLASQGGFTKTMALLTGSPAIDRVDCLANVTQDQRGILRPQGLRCDMGAYEFVP